MIGTNRLVLRAARPDDADAFARVFCDPEVMRYVGEGRALSAVELDAIVGRMMRYLAEDGFGQLAVERRADGRLLGRAGFLPLDPVTWRSGSRREVGRRAEIEIGWTLEREAWGHGYAFEAATALVEHARDVLRLRRLVSLIQHGNERSVRLAERLGECYERDVVTSFGKPAGLYALELRPLPLRAEER
jgi:RimJ/RimL family protein N-acetyltransferase